VTGSRTFPHLRLGDHAGRWLSPAEGPVRAISGTAAASAMATEADLHADFTGDTCLRTNLATKRMLDAAEPGQVLEIISDNLSSVETIPFMLEGHGCEHLATVHQGDHWRIYARKRQLPPR
jgi:TusA-related sulfurtransferase